MKTHLIVVVALLVCLQAPGEARKFRGAYGKEMDADLMGVVAGQVVLQRAADDRIVQVSMDQLSREDQVHVRAVVATGTLPVFPEPADSSPWLVWFGEQNMPEYSQEALDAQFKYRFLGILAGPDERSVSGHVSGLVKLTVVHEPRQLKRMVTPLLDLLADPKQPRSSILHALGRIGDRRALPAILACLAKEELQSSAVEALGRFGDPSTLPAIIKCLEKEKGRSDVVEALARFREPQATEALVSLAGDPKLAGLLGGILVERGKYDAATQAFRLTLPYGDPQVYQKLVKAIDIKPLTELEQVYFWKLENAADKMIGNWALTRRVLLDELERGNTLHAASVLICLGQEDSVAPLLDALKKASGNTAEALATQFVICGKEPLEVAARKWASARDGKFFYTRGTGPSPWGKQRFTK